MGGLATVIEKTKKLKTVNGRHVDDDVVIYGNVYTSGDLSTPMRAKIRQLGVAGFYVKGSMTCYYWTEIHRTWRDYSPSDSNLPEFQTTWGAEK
jgi:hypothetical protein